MKVCATTLYTDYKTLLGVVPSLLKGEHRRDDRVSVFEKEFSQMEGAKSGVFTSLARIALYQSLVALGVKPGDRILMTPINIPEMMAVINLLELRPVFVDLKAKSFSIDVSDLECKIESSDKILFVTHLFGFVGEMDRCYKLCQQRGITLIQDCTQSNLAQLNDRPITAFGDLSIYSTCELKFVSTLRGAMVVSNNDELLTRVRAEVMKEKKLLGAFQIVKKWWVDLLATVLTDHRLFSMLFHHLGNTLFKQNPLDQNWKGGIKIGPLTFFGSDFEGMNRKIPPWMFQRPGNLQAKLGLIALDRVKSLVATQRNYGQRLNKIVGLTMSSEGERPSYWRYPLLLSSVEQADKVLKSLRKSEVYAERSGLSYLTAERLEARETIGSTILIPAHAYLNDKQLDFVGKTVERALTND